MNVFNNLNFRLKILIPIVIILIVTSLSILLLNRYYFITSFEKNNKENIENKVQQLYNNQKRIADKALYAASMIASMPEVKKAYKMYFVDTIDYETSIAELHTVAKNINAAHENYYTQKPKVHFHLFENGGTKVSSFYRTWSDKRGDDLTEFRKSLIKIAQTQKPVRGIEVGRSGLVIRGIAPIFSIYDQIVGSVEIIFSLDATLENMQNNKNEDFCLLMHQDLLKVATNFWSSSNVKKNSGKYGEFIYVTGSENFKKSAINIEALTKAYMHGKSAIKTNNIEYIYFPISDYMGQIVGISIYQFDLSEQNKQLLTMNISSAIASMLFLIISIFIVLVITKKIVTPLLNINKGIDILGHGDLITEKIEYKGNDEIKNIIENLNVLNENLGNVKTFANEIGQGNYESNMSVFNDKGKLGTSLVEMRTSLHKVAIDQENRRKEEQQRNWATQGLAMFADILRKNNDDIQELSYNIISNLVKYLKTNQGGLFVLNDDDKNEMHFELTASYAYNKRKHKEKHIEWGEGLIGRCALEKETIHMKDLPQEYISITSGLGEEVPSCLLIVPLKLNNEIFGVIELAGFTPYKEYEIEFVEKVAESIASTLSSVKINIRTARLLEESKEQAEKMSQQEEEMRQNMEEMQATQEEFNRREQELMERIADLQEEVESLKS